MKMLEQYYREHADLWAKKGWLDYLLNTFGDFKVAHAMMTELEEPIWTKHIPYSQFREAATTEEIAAVNNRTILQPEIVLDIEKPENITEIVGFLSRHNVPSEVWATGSRGYHIHIIEPDLAEDSKESAATWKSTFIQAFKADLQKKSTGAMIALENTPHWKTGQTKHLIGVI